MESKGTTEDGRRVSPWLWVALAVLLAFDAVQLAGTLLRDRLEGRLAVSSGPARPAEVAPAAEAAATPGEKAGGPDRFGPETREVEVISPAGAPEAPAPEAAPVPTAPEAPAATGQGPNPPAAKPAPTLPAAPPPRPQPAPKPPVAVAPAPTRPPAPPPESRPAAKPPAVADGKFLDLGVYSSQKYLRDTERTARDLGLSVRREELVRNGKGLRVTIPAGAEGARRLLQQWGYAFAPAGGGLAVYCYFPEEARDLSAELSRAGVKSATEPVAGRRPVWRVVAGPLAPAEARKVQQRLAGAGVEASLVAP